MKKKKILITELIAWIIASIIILSIVMCIIDTYLFIPRKKDDYLNFLSKYEQEIIIESKVEDEYSIDIKTLHVLDEKIDDSCFEAYNCSLKSNSDIKFIVGYGKFRTQNWEVYRKNVYVDNFQESVLKYLRDKYFETISINDNFSIDDAVTKIENKIEQWGIDAENYGILPTPYISKLKFNVVYYDKLIENVEIDSTYDTKYILTKSINNIKD